MPPNAADACRDSQHQKAQTHPQHMRRQKGGQGRRGRGQGAAVQTHDQGDHVGQGQPSQQNRQMDSHGVPPQLFLLRRRGRTDLPDLLLFVKAVNFVVHEPKAQIEEVIEQAGQEGGHQDVREDREVVAGEGLDQRAHEHREEI